MTVSDPVDITEILRGNPFAVKPQHYIMSAAVIDRLRAELSAAKSDTASCAASHIKAVADLSESRRLLDDARAQKPVAYMHNKRADVIHASVKSLLSDFAVNSGPESMLRPIDKSENYTIPLYAAAPVPAQPAAVPEAVAKDAIPAGWVFYSADASIQSSDPRRPMAAMIKRDVDGVQWWLQLTEEEKERTSLYSTGAGMTLTLAIQNAVDTILSAADTEVKK